MLTLQSSANGAHSIHLIRGLEWTHSVMGYGKRGLSGTCVNIWEHVYMLILPMAGHLRQDFTDRDTQRSDGSEDDGMMGCLAVCAGLRFGGPVHIIMELLGKLDVTLLRSLPVPTKQPSKEPGAPSVIT